MSELDEVVFDLRQLLSVESDDSVLTRRTLVARRLIALVETPEDSVRYGVTHERVCAMLRKRRTLAFNTDGQQSDFADDLRRSLSRKGLIGSLRIIGTSTTLFSLNPEKPPSHYFDALSDLSDIDVGLECPNLGEIAAKFGLEPSSSKLNPAGSFAKEQLAALLPESEEIIRHWQATLGRAIQLGAAADGKPTPFAWITDYVLPLD